MHICQFLLAVCIYMADRHRIIRHFSVPIILLSHGAWCGDISDMAIVPSKLRYSQSVSEWVLSYRYISTQEAIQIL